MDAAGEDFRFIPHPTAAQKQATSYALRSLLLGTSTAKPNILHPFFSLLPYGNNTPGYLTKAQRYFYW